LQGECTVQLCSSKSLNPKNYVSGSVVLYSADEA